MKFRMPNFCFHSWGKCKYNDNKPHICQEEKGHSGKHKCSCGKEN